MSPPHLIRALRGPLLAAVAVSLFAPTPLAHADDDEPTPAPNPSSTATAAPTPSPSPEPVKVEVSLTKVPTIAEAGKRAHVEGSVTGEPGVEVHAEAWTGSGWTRTASATSHSANGTFTLELSHDKTKTGKVTYRVAADATEGTTASEEFTLTRMQVSILIDKAPTTAEVKKKAKVQGRIVGQAGLKVRLEAWTGSKWQQTAATTADAKGKFQLQLDYKSTKTGKVKYQVLTDSAVGLRKSEKFVLERLGWKSKITPTKPSEVKYTYRKGCSVGPSKLSTITMTYRGYDGDLRTGTLIVHKSVAKKVRDAFKEGFDKGFRIYRMDNPDLWKGDDIKMMAANNTSAFNCRQVTGNPSRVSPHTYGKSIDINPAENPYRVGGRWYPHGKYATIRPKGVTGMLYKDGPMVKALEKRGFRWFSGWDWHHFQR